MMISSRYQYRGGDINTNKKIIVNFYVCVYFVSLYGCEDPEDPICEKRRTGFFITFNDCRLLWVSRLQMEVYLSSLHSKHVSLSKYLGNFFPLKNIIK